MARTDTLGHFLTDVADAIREKKGTSETITASDFDTEIENLPSGGDLSEYFDLNPSGSFSFSGIVKKIPLINTSNVTSMSGAFANMSKLIDIPILDTSNVTNFSSFIFQTKNLNNESLDNILQMCINATHVAGNKTLSYLGFNSSSYPASRIEALPHYQDFIDAGWTIGYE